jgi:hypothetical protein
LSRFRFVVIFHDRFAQRVVVAQQHAAELHGRTRRILIFVLLEPGAG